MMKKIKYILISALLVSTVALSGCGGKGESTAEQSSYTPTPTDTTVKTTGEKILINDSTLGEIWITELANVPKNTLDKNNFSADANFKYYNVNGKAASAEGVDVSDYNGTIDWKKVKDSGIDFAMIRIGGRGYGTEGTLYQDENAIKNITEAKDNGIKVGVYFFSQAINTDEAIEEANYVKDILGDIKLDYPVAYDWEIVKDDDARTDNVTAYEATECARAFCQTVESNGYTASIYSPSRELYFKYDLSRLKDYDIWYCEYSDTPEFYYQFSMWQYTTAGKVDGIDGEVDLNICFTGIADYA